MLSSTGARAASCTFEGLKRGHERMMDLAARGPSAELDNLARTLSQRGLAPAERLMAHSLERKGKRAQAAIYAWRASRSGDAAAEKLRRKLLKGMKKDKIQSIRKGAAQPLQQACPQPVKAKAKSTDRWFFGDLEIRLVDLKDFQSELVNERLELLIAEAMRLAPNAGTLFRVIRRIEVIPGGRYDRYIGWRDVGEKRVLQFSVANLLDEKPTYAARALLLAASEEWFNHLKGASFRDLYGETYKGIRIRGSLYPDHKNKPFLEAMRRAIDMGARLPKAALPAFNAIGEIRYNPPSKHFKRFGPADSSVAFYRRGINQGKRRVIFIRRNVRWDSPLGLLLSLVHEGQHILQDQKAERYRRSLKNGTAGSQAKARKDYVNRWYRGVEREDRRISDITFECEALALEITVAKHLDAPVSSVASSGYLGVCPDANIAINRWKDDRMLSR
ncbi:MAG: hypothetical protein ACPGOV_16290 [Magnetovibrionaceae bacterium]